jgi:lysophospholipase L1-like esterase
MTVIHRSKVVTSVLLAALVLLVGCGGSSPATLNFPTPTATVKPTVVYVALGASDAVGVGATDPNTEGYVARIIARLPKGTSFALNLGVDGILEHEALAQELPEALSARPTVMTVWLVGNDFRDCTPLAQYTADLATLLTQLHDGTSAQIFVANTPDMSLLPYFKQGAFGAGSCFHGMSLGAIRSMAEQWNAAMDPIIARHGDVLVDLFNSDLAAHPDYIAFDGFHPSNAGYAVLADLFWAQIAEHHAVPGA